MSCANKQTHTHACGVCLFCYANNAQQDYPIRALSARHATKRKAIPLECASGMAIFSSRFATAKMQLRVFSRRNCAHSKPDHFLSDGMQSFTAFPTFKYTVCIIGSLHCSFEMETQLKLPKRYFIEHTLEWCHLFHVLMFGITNYQQITASFRAHWQKLENF
jgi:hypothetical protein